MKPSCPECGKPTTTRAYLKLHVVGGGTDGYETSCVNVRACSVARKMRPFGRGKTPHASKKDFIEQSSD